MFEYNTLKSWIKPFKKNPRITMGLIFVIILIIAVMLPYMSSFFTKRGEINASKHINDGKKIIVSQLETREDKDKNLVIEFTLKNENHKKILIKEIILELSKRLPESGGGGPDDIISKYNITFDNKEIKLETNNEIKINKETYVAYIRDYNTGSTHGGRLIDGISVEIKSPFQLTENTYTSFRITIPFDVKILDIMVSTGEMNYLEIESEIIEIIEKKQTIKTFKDFNEINKIKELMRGLFIIIKTDAEKNSIISDQKIIS